MARARRGAARAAAKPASALRLWAPWRASYLRDSTRRRRCIFCTGSLDARARRRRLVLFQDALTLVMLNRYPYNNGHVMVASRRHVASPELLRREERDAISELLAASVGRLRAVLRPAGFNLGANLGRAAGAGFEEHLHWHIVPRWNGDTNFMPVLASTRVLSQHLEASYRELEPVFRDISARLS
jgi:ATP adenylyltransferase